MDESSDTSKTFVKTYVPAYQKQEWKRHADELDMSLSEFVKAMVQAGRRGFTPSPVEPDSPDVTPRGNVLETHVLELLSADTCTWDELLDAVTVDVESRLDETLDDLQSSNRVRYSGRDGGYVLVDGDTDGD